MVTTIGSAELLVGGALVAVGLALSVVKIKNGAVRAGLGALLAVAVVVGAVEYRRVRTIPPTDFGPGATYFADPKVALDEDVAVSAHGSQGRSFTLSADDALQVTAEGKAHADKGFHVYVMSAEDFESFSKKKPFHFAPAFEGIKAKSYARTGWLPGGVWYVVVENSEGGAEVMTVHLRVVSDPS